MDMYWETNSSCKFMPIKKIHLRDKNDYFVAESSDTLDSKHFCDLHLWHVCMYICKVVDLQDLSFTEYFGIGMKFPCLMN